MPNHSRARSDTTKNRTVLLSTTALLLALTGCTVAPVTGTPVAEPPPTTTTTRPTATALTTTASPSSSATPRLERDRAAALTTAKQWLAAYRGDHWTDTTPTAWIDRVRPLITTRMHNANSTVGDAIANHDWQSFVTGRCSSTVTDLEAVIPPEAPNTDTTVHVHVAATIRTTCAAGAPIAAEETAAATLTLALTPQGWLVDHRIH